MKNAMIAILMIVAVFFAGCKTTAMQGSITMKISSSGITKGIIAAEYGQFGDVANIEEKIPGTDTNGNSVVMKVNKLSLPLRIAKAPADTKAFVLYLHDPDAATHGFGDFTHWLVYFTDTNLSEDASRIKPMGMVQGMNGWGFPGYAGMGPPDKLGFTSIVGGPTFEGEHDYHTYVLEVFALSEELSLKEGFSSDEMNLAIKDKIIGQGVLSAKYYTDKSMYK
ncbi:MAG: YbhB/YbcL family Raf kinase inhibitor-like protein [Treponemataceae bacterium]